MSSITKEEFLNIVLKEKIIAIVRGVDPNKIIKVTQVLSNSGIHLVEITCNTPGVDRMIQTVSARLRDKVLLGAGTVVNVELAELVIASGAKYIITPNLDQEVINYCQRRNVPIVPGVTTPSEILQAMKHGLRMVKLFPAGALGTTYIKQIRGPIKDVSIVAVGGINLDNALDMLQAGADALGIGESLVNTQLVENEQWDEIEHRAKKLVKIRNYIQS
ncbi:bifunctional 4-hydroxy-2-oxoglutarate aldolase/2-dehydro-3-deoxy-phosphogluconate aldolase [Candidatus Calescamantes bacterium]|nr:bifunctional 4-hydroxy-2-oxoglutarate aldolase/2-dehydro-3-deoxy-phosphogluconate aldolase [Candidatus Calescamantes bacterium]